MLGVGALIGRGAMAIINAMVRALASLGIPPNVLTLIGVTINLGCGVLHGLPNRRVDSVKREGPRSEAGIDA